MADRPVATVVEVRPFQRPAILIGLAGHLDVLEAGRVEAKLAELLPGTPVIVPLVTAVEVIR